MNEQLTIQEYTTIAFADPINLETVPSEISDLKEHMLENPPTIYFKNLPTELEKSGRMTEEALKGINPGDRDAYAILTIFDNGPTKESYSSQLVLDVALSFRKMIGGALLLDRSVMDSAMKKAHRRSLFAAGVDLGDMLQEHSFAATDASIGEFIDELSPALIGEAVYAAVHYGSDVAHRSLQILKNRGYKGDLCEWTQKVDEIATVSEVLRETPNSEPSKIELFGEEQLRLLGLIVGDFYERGQERVGERILTLLGNQYHSLMGVPMTVDLICTAVNSGLERNERPQ